MTFLFIYRIEDFFVMKDYKIAVSSTGYVRLSIATLDAKIADGRTSVLSINHRKVEIDCCTERV